MINKHTQQKWGRAIAADLYGILEIKKTPKLPVSSRDQLFLRKTTVNC